MIVGLCGYIGSGKTTFAKHLIDNYGFWRIRFAGPLKDMMRALGLTDEEIDGNLKEQSCKSLGIDVTPRNMMQTLGTEWGREKVHPDLWVRAWKRSVERSSNSLIVADDVRFKNEANIIRDMGGTIIRIDRPGVAIGSHVSEALPFLPDATVHNDSNIDKLLSEADWFARNIWKIEKAA